MKPINTTKAKDLAKSLTGNKNILYIVVLAFLVVLVIFAYIQFSKGTPVPVDEAKTRVTDQLKSLKLTGTVIHRKNTLNMYDDKGKIFNTVITETYEDNDSDKYLQTIQYKDSTVTKAFDGQTEYDFDPKSNTLKKTESVFSNGVTSAPKRGYRTEIINWFNEILSGEKVTAVENTVDGKEMFVVTVIKNTDDKYVHYFDKSSLTLLYTKIYKVKDGKDLLYQINKDDSFELITPTSEQARDDYFKFTVPTNDKTKVTTTQVDGLTHKPITK